MPLLCKTLVGLLPICLMLSTQSVVYASPVKDLTIPGNPFGLLCTINNVVIQGLGGKQQASVFCASHLAITTRTVSATVKATASARSISTISTGTKVITAPTLTSDIISFITATVVSTTDDTAALVSKRALFPNSSPIPSVFATIPAQVLSMACSCLSIPTPTVTILTTATSTTLQISTTSAFAATTIYTPKVYVSITEIRTATSVILKSDVIKSIVSLISQNSYQPFCSDIVDYTTPIVTVAQTAIVTAFTTSTEVITETAFGDEVIITSVQAKRRGIAESTPAPLATFPPDYISSACQSAVPTPAASIASQFNSITTTHTILNLATETVEATSTSTVTCSKLPLQNSGFEAGVFAPWKAAVDPNDDGIGAWNVVAAGIDPEPDSVHGLYVAQFTIQDQGFEDSQASGGLSQEYELCAGGLYTLSLQYRCTLDAPHFSLRVFAASSSISGRLGCGPNYSAAQFLFQAPFSFGRIQINFYHNGDTPGAFEVDNIVLALNE